ncbi:MAG: DNA gyrase subunit A [Proteobacteria bacterium]|nr:DNA gyrase subunit A [Pseudomonadota bacterium]MDA0884601.1 DNA gyrase subunit A [Pseudomonadota bacterium]MDA1149704.1 DNA gyrase subunit A [Pseudomonadota bacterium]
MTDITDSTNPTISISEEMRKSYLDYAMSVIVSRALPDVRDGLKPVHRRILYAMMEGNYDWSKPPRKSARVVGDVMGNYHPHGDSSIYEAMVRMAQDFSMRLPLVDGQGNFGSVDGDPAAAMRYTESRLARSAESLLRDIDKNTVEFIANYDETQLEPTVLPAEYPNLLVNGANGIAVGMATNIPPHNPGEVIAACEAYIANPEITTEEINVIVPGPDFPTGGLIMGRHGIREAYANGRGSIIMRAKAEVQTNAKDREAIIIHEIPYQVNKAQLLERIGEMVREKTIEGISDIRDESDRNGMRVVIEIKRDASGDVVLNQLYRHTRLQTSFPVNLLAMNGGRPQQMGIKDVIVAFCAFRKEVVVRRTTFLLSKARDRAHILAGLMVALASIDTIIELIKKAPDTETARNKLCETNWPAAEVADFISLIDDPGHEVIDGHYRLSETQARAILELRLQRLTGMERDKLSDETRELADKIADYLDILGSDTRVSRVVLDELAATRERLSNPRRTEITDQLGDQDDEDLIQQEDMVVTVSHRGYIKRVPLSIYRAQRRGGKGRAGMKTRDEDFVTRLFVTNTHTPILFFTSRGMVYQLKCYKLPEAAPQSLGKAMVNILPIEPEETINTVMPMPEDESSWADLNVMFATASGNVRRNNLSDFTNIKRNGKIAMKLQDGDDLVGVLPCSDEDDVLMATRNGKAIRFAANAVRVFRGRDSTGVRGIRLLGGDRVVSMSIIADEDKEFILSVTENGYGKRTPVSDYRRSGRGGQGVANIETSKRNGQVMASFAVVEEDQLMLVTNMGQVIRIRVHGGEGDSIRIASRKTQGVRLFDVADDESEKVVSAGLVRETDSDEDSHEGGHTEGYGGENNGDQAGDGTGETAAIAQNAPTPNIKDGQDAVDAPSDANNASNQAGDEENQ